MPIHDDWILKSLHEGGFSSPLESPLLRQVMARRGVDSEEEYRRFVAPSVEDLHDGSTIHGMDAACERILRAIRDRESILIYGDYDVDGVTSIVLLKTVLGRMGAVVDFVIPHRLIDGYGLKSEVLERVEREKDVRLVITVDCGITSVEPVRSAIERGIDVIITDHHLPPEDLPAAAAVLNPKQPGCLYPFKELAGVGVAFKLCCELIRRSGSSLSILSLLKIAAIGTVADVAPLIGENRTITALGLEGLADSKNLGLRSLLRSVGVEGRGLLARDVGFKVGPRINAAGRLASADTAIELFSTVNEADASRIVMELNRLNSERQGIEADVRTAAEEQVAGMKEDNIFVLHGEGWHRGVLGLAAGRLAQKYHRPVLMISVEGASCVGSGRSIGSIDLHSELEALSHLFTHFGGHEFACGFSLPLENLSPLKSSLRKALGERDSSLFRRTAYIEGELSPAELTRQFIAEHQKLEPFGQGNPRPLFLFRGVTVGSIRQFAEGCHEVTLKDGAHSVPGVIWKSQSDLLSVLTSGNQVDVLAHADPSRFAAGGVSLEIIDASPAGQTEIRNESPQSTVRA